MNSELVSVIMPTYNRSSTILRAVESVIKQTYSNWELYIVDDAGNDDTFKVIFEHYHNDSRIHYLRNSENKGPAFSRNVGIKHSSGDYYAFLDSDDEWICTHLEEALTALKRNNYMISSALWYEKICEKKICILQSEWYKQSLNHIVRNLKVDINSDIILFKNNFYEYIINTGFYCFHINTIVMKKEVIDTVGLFDDSLKASEDMDLLYRIFENYNLLLINKPHFIYHFGTDNIYAFNERSTVFEKKFSLSQKIKERIIYTLIYKIVFFKKLKKRCSNNRKLYPKVRRTINYNIFRRYLTILFLEKHKDTNNLLQAIKYIRSFEDLKFLLFYKNPRIVSKYFCDD